MVLKVYLVWIPLHIASEWNRIKNAPDKGGFRDYRDFKASALIVKQIYESYKRPRPSDNNEQDQPASTNTNYIEKSNYRGNLNTNMNIDMQENLPQESGSGRGPTTGRERVRREVENPLLETSGFGSFL
ncbi:unnamed protein product [Ceratitis capitata]|uniref:(Mediterranean fruit fly) hypothetical protein n=1 Tax=Ceratitis capitata TaxID=7213 RepID=A0A811V904_CERCA|nr:unnamed protein product [Ceratitis capitata]